MSEPAAESDPSIEPEQVEVSIVDNSEERPDTGEQPQEESAKDWQAEANKWQAMARKHEKTAKANAEAARKYTEFEESQKTEQQRLADRAEAAERRALEAEVGRARLMAAAAYNIPPSLLDRIGGSSEDEINEAAEELAAELGAAVEAEVQRRLAAMPAPEPAPEPEHEYPSRRRPVESLAPGGMPANREPEDGNDYLRRLAGRRT